MKRRSESTLLSAILALLQTWENSGRITHFDRLNSGKIFIPPYKGRPGRKIRLCREGTPDAFIILKSGSVIWIETKIGSNKLSAAQEEFKTKIEKAPGHVFKIAKKIDDLILIKGV